MAVDTPAKIVIIGAGPIGIEAALYARFLGYEVTILDQGLVGHAMRQWGHVRMFSSFSMNSSPLGRSALLAQEAEIELPQEESILSGQEYLDRYLLPLANSDLLIDSLMLSSQVIAVGRVNQLKGESIGKTSRGETQFTILIRDQDDHEKTISADVIIDCSGTFSCSNFLGNGGIPAAGELAARSDIEYRLPDILGKDRQQYAAKQTLVIGAGYSAATNVCALGQLATESLETHITWITREKDSTSHHSDDPMKIFENDPLKERDRLAKHANLLASDKDAHVTHWANTLVETIHFDQKSEHFQVTLRGENPGTFTFDNVIANVGFRPDWSMTQELQIHHCYASEGPMKLAAQLLQNTSENCLDQTSTGAQTLLNPEPNFYVLGAKSYGRNSQFLISVGLEQIKELFTVIGDREDLDLYQNAILPK